MDLPKVSLGTEPAPCRRTHPAPVTAHHAVSGDAQGDARGDGTGDGRGDGTGDGGRPVGPVLTLRPQTLTVPPPAQPAPGNLPVVVLTERRPMHARGRLMVQHWAMRGWQSAARTVANPRGPYHAQPESLAGHDAYRRSRAWVPPGHDGKLLGPAGAGYHMTFAKFGMTTGYGWAWLWARPLRITIAAAVVAGIVLGFWLG